jgi:hypothetical protein
MKKRRIQNATSMVTCVTCQHPSANDRVPAAAFDCDAGILIFPIFVQSTEKVVDRCHIGRCRATAKFQKPRHPSAPVAVGIAPPHFQSPLSIVSAHAR